jgi:hypothetical protein
MDAQKLYAALGGRYDPRPYTGRGMTEECIGVDLDSASELVALGMWLCNDGDEDDGFDPNDAAAPGVASMGRGIIAYWPDAKWADLL